MNTLAIRLKTAREDKGLTQDQLAKKAECSQGSIANVEMGIRFSMQKGATVARILGVDAYWLETGNGSKEPALGVILEGDEMEILDLYRKINALGRKAMRATARALIENYPSEVSKTKKRSV